MDVLRRFKEHYEVPLARLEAFLSGFAFATWIIVTVLWLKLT